MGWESWQISLLGEISARRPGEQVTRFATRQAAALFGFLAYHLGKPQARDYVSELLWPDGDPATGRTRLRVALASLRKQLEPPGTAAGSVIEATREQIELRGESCEVDVGRFRAALRAVQADRDRALQHRLRADEAYKGELMPGHREDWVTAARRELSELHVKNQLCLCELFRQGGRGDEALKHARKAIAADPLMELPRAAAIRVLLDRGDEGAARAELEAFKRFAYQRTGIRPSKDLEKLFYEPRETLGRLRSPEPPEGQPEPDAVSPEPVPFRRPSLIRPPGAFIGREAELEQVGSLLAIARVLTLTGPAGVGKTRLALEAAAKFGELFGAGAMFLSASGIGSDSSIAERVLEELGAPATQDNAARRIEEVLLSRVQTGDRRGFLLILDAMEVLSAEAIAELGRILRDAPIVTLLATSRRRLTLPGETEFGLLPLPTPGETVLAPADLARSPSVQLLIERSKVARADFQINSKNATLLGEICRRCEGFPLAIELAAASLRRTPAKGIARETAATHGGGRALAGALERTWSSLPLPLQKAAGQLCAFPGSWDAEAASAVLKSETAQRTLEELAANSLLVREGPGRETRYWFLETVKTFVEERTSPELLSEARERHARHFYRRAESFYAVARTLGPWKHEGLGGERENLACAFDWFLGREEGHITAARLAVRLGGYFYRSCMMREGRRWISRLNLPTPRSSSELLLSGRVKVVDGVLACQMDDAEAATEVLGEAVELLKRSESQLDLLWAEANLGFALYGIGEFKAAEEKFRLWLQNSSGHFQWVDSAFRNLLGFSLLAQGRFVEAEAEFRASIALNEELDDPASAVHSWLGIARTEWARGELDRALQLYKDCLKSASQFKDSRAGAYAAQGMARVFCSMGAWECAAPAFGIGERVRYEQGMREDAADRKDNGASMGQVKAALGERFEGLWRSGYEMSRTEAIFWLGQAKV